MLKRLRMRKGKGDLLRGPRSLWPSSYALMDGRGPERERDYRLALQQKPMGFIRVILDRAGVASSEGNQTPPAASANQD
jgi:hypothetical protein